MLRKNILTLLLALLSCVLLSESKTFKDPKNSVRKFPDGFLFGASTASYQVEGGWDADGKGVNIWDHLTHTNPCATDDCKNGDIANDSYNQYKRDVEMMRELGLQVYRFSLSWSRILPTGFPDKINEAGVQYYNNLIDEMLKYNIQPLVTLFHWDLPQKLQDLGGWANPHVVDWFSDYARVVYEQFGDRVKYWITINEPHSICQHGYGLEGLAPRLNSKGVGEYMCAKNLLVAHATAYHIYDKEFRESQGGVVSLCEIFHWNEPASDNEVDVQANEVVRSFEFELYTYPIFSETGDWPPILKERIAAKSAAQGFARSRLPEFTPEEIELVRGAADFFGLNHYTTYLVYKNQSMEGYYDVPSYADDYEAIKYQPSEWNAAASSWLKDYATGFYNLLTHVRKVYNNPPIFITENGFSTRGGLDDDERVTYYRGYISAMLDAMDEGSDIRVYSLWSLMDNFEWMRGYTERFGLYEVDYESPERTRTPRKSAYMYKEIVRTRALDLSYEPDTSKPMTIDEGH